MSFVHLHVHSRYSLLEGTMEPKEIPKRAARAGMSAVALTDVTNLFGAVPFWKSCKEQGVQPILGAELHVQPQGRAYEDPAEDEGGYQILALVESAEGYRNLCGLITDAIFEGMHHKPRVDLTDLARYRQGLVFLSGGMKGVVGRSARLADGAEAQVVALRDAVGADRLYLELVSLGLEGETSVIDATRQVAAALKVPTVVTNAVHYAEPQDAVALETLYAIGHGGSVASEQRLRSPTDQAWFKSPEDMRALWPNDLDAVERTLEIAGRCTFELTLGKYHFPSSDPPDSGQDTDANWRFFYEAFPPSLAWGLPPVGDPVPSRPSGGGTLDGYFRWYAEVGLRQRLGRIPQDRHPEYFERMNVELDIICSMQFPAYFLIVAEFINWSKDQGIPVGPGRGSAAGSVVAWGMGITDIDPIRFDLLFERFLNPERNSMPDIDVDFAQDRREESIQHVRDKYGAEKVSQIITYNTLKAKAAVKDVARVMGMSFKDSDRLSKLFSDKPGTTIDATMNDHEREESAELRVRDAHDPRVRRVIEMARRVEGFPKSLSIHAAGVVIGDGPLKEYAPLYRDGPEGGPVVQYDMKSAEDVGLIKFDFLGLKTLDQIRDAVEMVRQNDGVVIRIDEIDEDDAETYALFGRGDTQAVFQFESEGMRRMLRSLKPTVLDDLVAAVALYRPGPLESGMDKDFIARKHGIAEVSYPLPSLEPILRSTYGTIIYQEQVMQIAQVMSGYSLGEADLLRRAMGKKKAEEMAKQKSRFVSGAVAQGIDEAKADEIFEILAKFAAYGFNKSHSAAYGYIAYQTAWLKAHHRAEFMAAAMTVECGTQKGRDEKVPAYIEDCRGAGIPVVPPCLNRSQHGFSADNTPQGKQIRFGLGMVKNVGASLVEAILEERARGGAFQDPLDVFIRLPPRAHNRRAMESLVVAGAFDTFGVNRGVLLASLADLAEEGGRRRKDREVGQVTLFGGQPSEDRRAFRYADATPWSLTRRLEDEYAVLGVYLSGRPMEAYPEECARWCSHRFSELDEVPAHTPVTLLGWPVDVLERTTRSGDRMAIVELDGLDGRVRCQFFSDAYARSRRALAEREPLLVRGKMKEDRDGGMVVSANVAESLTEVRGRLFQRAVVKVGAAQLTEARTQQLVRLVQEQSGDMQVQVELTQPGEFRVVFDLQGLSVSPTRAFEEGVEGLFGRREVLTWE